MKQHLATDLQGMDLAAMRAELLELNPKGLPAGKHSKALKKLNVSKNLINWKVSLLLFALSLCSP